jgi:uncharacterized RDD family membrane protein YckC
VGFVGAIVLVIIGARGFGLQLGLWAIIFAYQCIMLGVPRGQTVGNMAVATRTVDANTGGPIGFGRAAIRSVVLLVLQVTIIGGILDILWPLWDRQNQTIHDKTANSLVIRTR